MRKKPEILSILFVLVISSVFLASRGSTNKTSIQSKKSHAEKLWKTSGHADKTAEAFTNWDDATPKQIPATCAKCHSTPGFKDFLGVDGTALGVVDNPAPTGTTVECEICHIDKEKGIIRDHTSVVFPSGSMAKDLGPEAICMECHQGRTSKVTVDDAIAAAGAIDDDTVNKNLRFQNIHYYAAAATQFGTFAKGGYEYAGKSYDARFAHITGYNACITCHNPHSLDIDLESCRTCHSGVKDPKDIRFYGSLVDYDGDKDIREGVYYEIAGLQGKFYDSIRKYAKDVIGKPIAYDDHTYPYFFNDNNGNGVVDSDEANSANAYRSFTPRLLKSAYNFQVSKKDPGGFAHGGKYIIQLIYDSIEDLNAKLENFINLAEIRRADEGHFDGSAEAWRHWDGEGDVSRTCAKCHSAEGLPYFLEKGAIDKDLAIANGLLCTTCHTSPPTVRRVATVTFPSGAVKSLGDSSNLCMNCHQGRASKYSIDQAISKPGPYTFINIHYYPTAAVFFGNEVHGGYEFDNKLYVGRKIFANHNGMFDTCVECHMGTNSFNRTGDERDDLFHNVDTPKPADCVFCHGQDISQPHPGADPAKFEFSAIRPASIPDYDGDGNMKESLKDEILGLEESLLAQMQIYSFTILGKPIVYDEHSYPYFFNDLNANGKVDPGENSSANGFRSFNAALLKAAYNYHLSKKEPCGFIHNSRYIAQLLVDSIENLGGNINAYSWR